MRWEAVARRMAQVGEAAASSKAPGERGSEVLEALRALVPFDCAALATVRHGELDLLAELDSPAGIAGALKLPEYRAEHAELRRLGPGVAQRFADLSDGGVSTFTATELAWPAGFRGGLGMALFARDGREVGFLSCNTEAASGLTAEHRDVVGLLGGILGEVADVVGTLAARHGADLLVHADGRLERLPGGSLPEHPRLLRSIAALAANARTESAFLLRGSSGRWWRTRVVPVPVEGCAVVHLREDAAPDGLTTRELEVLTLLARGWTNAQIAGALVIARGTVRSHVEHVLAKLGAASRTQAAVIAASEGLVIRQVTD